MGDFFDSMRVFVAVADAKGFVSAARRMTMSTSAVSRVVATLETRLGVRLLQRTTRTVRLTDAGARFLERCRRILAEVDEAEQFAQEEDAEPRGRLTISAPVLFGRIHVAAVVSRYLQRHSNVSVDLRLSDGIASLVEDGIDVAIRIGNLADSSLIVRRLGSTRRVLVASPKYLTGSRGVPHRPSDLPQHDLISFEPITPKSEWSFWESGTPTRIAIQPKLTTNSGDAALDHALAGGGIVAALCYQVDNALQNGHLVEVLGSYAPPPVPIQAVYPTTRLLSSKVRAFLNLVEASASNWTRLNPRSG